MKNFKWGTESLNDRPIHVVLFVSRNKDNADINDFKERRTSFITHDEINSDELRSKFNAFVKQGVNNELSRMYYSVNARNPKTIYTELMHFLFDNPDFNLCSIQSKLADIAAKKECAAEKHWMFDFDIDDPDKADKFINDIIRFTSNNTIGISKHKTPHGFAIITDRGFDTRPLFEIWNPDLVTLKKDDLLCYCWKKNTKEGE